MKENLMRPLIRPLLLAALISLFVACTTPGQPTPDLNADLNTDDTSIITDVEVDAGEDFDVSKEAVDETVDLATTTAQRGNFSLKLSFSKGVTLNNNVPYRAHAILNWTGSSPLNGNLKLVVRRKQNTIAVNTTNKSLTLLRNKAQKISSGVVKVSPDTLLCVDAVFTQAAQVSTKTLGRTITYCQSAPSVDKTAPNVTLNASLPSTRTSLNAQAVSNIEITAPGKVNFAASATDNVGVRKIQLLEGDIVKAESNSNPLSASLNLNLSIDYGLADVGTHTYVAKAYDAAGNVGSSELVQVKVLSPVVLDTTAPVLTLETRGLQLTSLILNLPELVSFKAFATDDIGVTKIVFTSEVGGGSPVLEAAVTGPGPLESGRPFSVADVNKEFTFRATAFDAAGNSSTKDVVVKVVDQLEPEFIDEYIEENLGGGVAPSQVTINVRAFDIFGIAKIQWFEGTNLLKEVAQTASASHTITYGVSDVGEHHIKVIVFDAAGNSKQRLKTLTVNRAR
jgi:hypothetical protein